MEYNIAIATFLLHALFQTGTSQEHTLSRIKVIPKATKLPDLDYTSLPEYFKYIIAPVEWRHRNVVNSKSLNLKAKNLKVPKTYGMSIVNDHAFVWNDLTKPETFYEDEDTEHKDNNESEKETISEVSPKDIEDIRKKYYKNNTKDNTYTDKDILTDVVKDSTKPQTYDKQIMHKSNSSKIETIDDKPSNIKENNKDINIKPIVNADKSINTNNTLNITGKLMQEIEKAINDVMKNVSLTSDASTAEDLIKHDKPRDCNSSSDVAQIPVKDLQSIFDDIIKNYSSTAYPNTTNVEDGSNKPNTTSNPSEISNVDVENSHNETIPETTPSMLDFEPDKTSVENKPTTEITMVDKDMANDVKINDENSNIQEVDSGEAENPESVDGSANEKGNKPNNTLNNKGDCFNATNIVKQLLDDRKFRQLVNESTSKFLEPFIQHLGTEIKNEVATQLEDYFQSLKVKNNQTTSDRNCTNTTEPEQIEDVNVKNPEESTGSANNNITEKTDINKTEPSQFIELYMDNSTETNEMSTESSLLVNTIPQTMYICEACKVIFNLNLNVTNNVVNKDEGDTNAVSIIGNLTNDSSFITNTDNKEQKPDLPDKVDDDLDRNNNSSMEKVTSEATNSGGGSWFFGGLG